jgi:DNA-binding beta-propeller fold protein YncE
MDMAGVIRFDAAGNAVTQWGGPVGSATGSFNSPMGVDTDAAGNVYVADSNNGRIQVFDANGNFLRQMAGMSWVTDVSVAPNGEVQASDNSNWYIVRFSASGAPLATWNYGWDGSNSFYTYSPYGVEVDTAGRVWVASSYYGNVARYIP